MQGPESHNDYSEEDLEFYRRLGFQNEPGQLRPIPHEVKIRAERYKSLDDPKFFLIWTNPLLWFASKRGQGSLTPDIDQDLMITETLSRTRKEIKENIQDAEKIIVPISIFDHFLDQVPPYARISILNYGSTNPTQLHIRLEDVVGATFTSEQQILDLANASIWGQEGALKKLADMTGKPVFGRFKGVEIGYIPQPPNPKS